MYIMDLLQKNLQPLVQKSRSDLPIDIVHLRTILVGLVKNIHLLPDKVVRHADDGILDALCVLNQELKELDPENILFLQIIESRELITNISADIQRVIREDVTYKDTQGLIDSLQQLLLTLNQLSKQTQSRKKRFKSLLLMVSLVPALGYSVHWSISHFYQQAILDTIDFVYPETPFIEQNGIYTLDKDVVKELVQKQFSSYYFSSRNQRWKLEQQSNPLPMAFNADAASAWGLIEKLDDKQAKAISVGIASRRQFGTHNLFMFRAFIRNIRDNNIVNRFHVEVERINDQTFPWQLLDVDTEIEIEQDSNHNQSIIIRTTQAPVVDASIVIQANYGGHAVLKPYQETVEEIINQFSITPEWDAPLVTLSSTPYSPILIDQEATQKLQLDDRHRLSYDKLVKLMSQDALSKQVAELGYLYLTCSDKRAVIFAGANRLQQLFSLQFIDALDIDISYKLLNGIQQTKHEPIRFAEPQLLLTKGMETDFYKIDSCRRESGQSLVFLFEEFELAAAAAMLSDNWLNSLDKVSVMLADKKKEEAPIIIAEQTLLFDFRHKQQKLQQTIRKTHILKDGHYVLFNLATVNFSGGDYRYRIYFDDKLVAQSTVNLLWPPSLHYQPDDEKYFAAQFNLKTSVDR